MEKFEEMALLLDIYGELLTQKQKDVMDQYYNYDLSLQEIAENIDISKQGVHDLIRRAENSLRKTDEKLGFLKRLSGIQSGLEELRSMLEYYCQEDMYTKNFSTDQKNKVTGQPSNKLEVCLDKLDKLINTCLGG
jgi:predicted DNA-binding protein YlxM (UPF0122 family)